MSEENIKLKKNILLNGLKHRRKPTERNIKCGKKYKNFRKK